MTAPRNQLQIYHDRHRGETILVCGCGVSLNDLPSDYAGITIGVNDVGRRFHPTYLVVLNPPSQFRDGRFRHVTETRAQAVFTQLDLGLTHPNVVRFRLGQRGGTAVDDSGAMPYTRNSTYVALCLALYMGAKRIGLIGVDFTDHHFFARTGPHPLNRELATIDKEFAALAAVAAARGVDIVNLSAQSRVTAFTKVPLSDFVAGVPPASPIVPTRSKRVFFVNYRFKTCGDVFSTGLHHAAEGLGLTHASAYWDDPGLARKVAAFAPELLFVVHGRSFTRRWRGRIAHPNTAVWLLDEPYEVDDTVRYSTYFTTVFVNDYATLARHHNAHYLPAAFDPALHLDAGERRDHEVGFIGGYSPHRQKMLEALLDAGRLSYVVGGPWRSRRLRAVMLRDWLAPEDTARLYRRTKVVINVFRDRHHYNAAGIEANTLNPRVYEALACGAAVVSEPRPELAHRFPALPSFGNADELVARVVSLLDHDASRTKVVRDCAQSLANQTYQHRLEQVLEICMETSQLTTVTMTNQATDAPAARPAKSTSAFEPPDGWGAIGGVSRIAPDGTLRFEMAADESPGAERGIASTQSLADVELRFELRLGPDACFIAKIHQLDRVDQTTNSYHMMCRPARAGQSYLGMHNRVLSRVALAPGVWHRVALRHRSGRLQLDLNGRQLYSRAESTLAAGFCFLGVKGGVAEVRALSVAEPLAPNPKPASIATTPDYEVLQGLAQSFQPRLSIVTTVYDRVACLERCLESVGQLQYQDFEHIVVADHPPASVVKRIQELVGREGGSRTSLLNLRSRHNDWGIAPAAAGLSVARGEYLCFLSDDNGYMPEHFNPLIQALDRNPALGFVYSSCKYAGRMTLRSPVPRPGAIDLGQPLFRRDLFERHLGGGLPFDMMAWDWYMIKAFMDRGVRWRHVNRETFLFRLREYLPAVETAT